MKRLLAILALAVSFNANAATFVFVGPMDYPTDALTFLVNITDEANIAFTWNRNIVIRQPVASMAQCEAARDALLPNINGVIACEK